MCNSEVTLTAKRIEFSFLTRSNGHKKNPPDIGPLDITLRKGEKTVLIGASGSGKSTTLKLLTGLLSPTNGDITFNNMDLTKLSERRKAAIRRTDFAFIFQDYMLIENLTVSENIALPTLLNSGVYTQDNVVDAMSKVNLDSSLLNKPVFKLSGGQKQRVAISRSLMTQANILFADEPTGNLDPRARNETLDAIDSAMKYNLQSCLMVTHDPIVAARADRVLFMQDGKICKQYAKLTADEVNDILLGNQ